MPVVAHNFFQIIIYLCTKFLQIYLSSDVDPFNRSGTTNSKLSDVVIIVVILNKCVETAVTRREYDSRLV